MTEENTINRKEQLREVACELFLKHGFDATSMSSIAKHAGGVSKRTPYIYYDSKHDLFSAVIRGFLQELEKLLEPLWQQRGGAVESITACVRAYANFAIVNPEKFKLIMTFEKRDFYPGRTQAMMANALSCQQTNDRITVNLQETVARAIADGELNTNMTAKQFSLLLWSALSGTLSIAMERKDLLIEVYDWSAQEMIDQFIEAFIHSNKIQPN